MINTTCDILGIERDDLAKAVRHELGLSDTEKLVTEDFTVFFSKRLSEFELTTEPCTPLSVIPVVESALHSFIQDVIHDMLIYAFVDEVVLNDFSDINVSVDACAKDSFDFSPTLAKGQLADRVVQRMSPGVAESFSHWLNTYHPHLGLIPTTLSLQQVANTLQGFGLDDVISGQCVNSDIAFTVNTLRLINSKEGLSSARRLFNQYMSSHPGFEAEIFSAVRSIVADNSIKYASEAMVTAVSLSQNDEPVVMSYEDYLHTITSRPLN